MPEEMALGTLQGTHRGGAKDKVSAAGTPYAAPHGKPECSLGLPLLVLKLYPELHSGIPPGGFKQLHS
ncbi:unnamed protein product [Staurois parvus]|uniref:Uncharacterized protein n=1 Tax=Staurois parvus TaxID=386267 RepID=A0ABN9CWX4_9NEOB|nr:unnamed protein product [Staurois parvus]